MNEHISLETAKRLKIKTISDGTFTATVSNEKYDKWYVNDLIRFVRETPREEDAVENIERTLLAYKNKITAWELIKLLFNKLKG